MFFLSNFGLFSDCLFLILFTFSDYFIFSNLSFCCFFSSVCFLYSSNFNLFSVKFSDIVGNVIFRSTEGGNISTAFRSKICFEPQQSVVGVGLAWQHEFCLCDRTYWVGISAPVVRVQNTMGLKEKILQEGEFYDVIPIEGQETNVNKKLRCMTEALVQDGWCFGKIDNKKHSKTQLAFIQAQFGTVWVDSECCHLEPYIGITIPTGNTPKARQVFEPIAGNGNHFGILWGGSSGYKIYDSNCGNYQLYAESEVVMQYLFSKTQKRSFDLKHKPWSRYIETYANKAQAQQANALGSSSADDFSFIFLNTPGINLLTLDAKVKPGFNFTFNAALVLSQCECNNGFDAEVGYNFYAKQAECLSLKQTFSTQAAIKDHAGLGITNPVRNMTNDQLINEASFLNLSTTGNLNPNGILGAYDRGIIKQENIDLASAAHPCVLSHTVYGTLGYHWDDLCYPIMAGIGASYEFSGKMNTSLDRWLVWGKFGLSY